MIKQGRVSKDNKRKKACDHVSEPRVNYLPTASSTVILLQNNTPRKHQVSNTEHGADARLGPCQFFLLL